MIARLVAQLARSRPQATTCLRNQKQSRSPCVPLRYIERFHVVRNSRKEKARHRPPADHHWPEPSRRQQPHYPAPRPLPHPMQRAAAPLATRTRAPLPEPGFRRTAAESSGTRCLHSERRHCTTSRCECIAVHNDCDTVCNNGRAGACLRKPHDHRKASNCAGWRPAPGTRQTLENIQHAGIPVTPSPEKSARNGGVPACNNLQQRGRTLFRLPHQALPAASSACPSLPRRGRRVQFSAHPSENACHGHPSTVMLIADIGARPFRTECGAQPRAPRATHTASSGTYRPSEAGNVRTA